MQRKTKKRATKKATVKQWSSSAASVKEKSSTAMPKEGDATNGVAVKKVEKRLQRVDSIAPKQHTAARQIMVRNREQADSRNVLDEIYDHGEDITTMKKRGKGHRVFMGFLLITLILLSASIAGYFFFSGSAQFKNDIELLLTVPAEVASGEEMTIVVDIVNNESTPLRDAELRLDVPVGFYYDTGLPTPISEEDFRWDFGSIAEGKIKRLEVHGRLVGDIDSVGQFAARLQYKPGNFNYDFEAVATAESAITSSTIALALQGPENAVKDQEVAYTITMINESQDALADLRIRVLYPKDFIAKSFSQDPDEAGPVSSWVVPSLAVAEERVLTITGLLGGSQGTTNEMRVEAGVVARDQEFQLQAQANALTLMVEPQFLLTTTLADAQREYTAAWGEQLQGEVRYSNNGQSALENVVIKLLLDRTVFDLATFSSDKTVATDGDGIRWSFSDNTDLVKLAPGSSGSFLFSIAMREQSAIMQEQHTDYTASVRAHVAEGRIENVDAGDAIAAESNTVTVSASTSLIAGAEARYYDNGGNQVGSGPLPPEVGRETHFRVYWSLQNVSSDVTDTTMSTVLPQSILWDNSSSTSAGDAIVFEPETRTVAWTINRVPAHSGGEYPALTAWFDVSVEPKADEVGKYLILTEQTTVEGIDSGTNKKAQATALQQSTKLPSDPVVAERGKVVEATAPTTPLIPDVVSNTAE